MYVYVYVGMDWSYILEVLDVEFNYMSGFIPSTIGSMSSLGTTKKEGDLFLLPLPQHVCYAR
jgi:hypothetical protein